MDRKKSLLSYDYGKGKIENVDKRCSQHEVRTSKSESTSNR